LLNSAAKTSSPPRRSNSKTGTRADSLALVVYVRVV
jgi:hypothetical protein